MDPAHALAQFHLGEPLLVAGHAAEAVPVLRSAVERTGGGPAALGLLAMAYGRLGERAEAQRIVDELERGAKIENVPTGALLLGYLGTDDRGHALDMIERGYAERDNYEVNIVADPLMDPLRREPRFNAVCRRVMLGASSRMTENSPSGAWGAKRAAGSEAFLPPQYHAVR